MARPYRDAAELVTRPAVLMPPFIIDGAVTVEGVAHPGIDQPLPLALDPRFEYRIRGFVDSRRHERMWIIERRAVATRAEAPDLDDD